MKSVHNTITHSSLASPYWCQKVMSRVLEQNYFLRSIPTCEHVTSSSSSGHAQVLPPFGVGRHRYLHPPLFLKQALFTETHKMWNRDEKYQSTDLAYGSMADILQVFRFCCISKYNYRCVTCVYRLAHRYNFIVVCLAVTIFVSACFSRWHIFPLEHSCIPM